MSANTNLTRPDRKKKILVVASNPATSPVTGWPVGFWWAELTHPYVVFEEAGYDVEIRSPRGGRLEPDMFSDPGHESGYSAHDFISLGFKTSPQHAKLLEETRSIDGVDVGAYDAIFLVGGIGPMVTFVGNEPLKALVARFYEAGKMTAVVCHATAILLETKLQNGDLLVKDKTWTGFSDAEERYADDFAGQRLQPFWIEEAARKLPDTNFVVGPVFRDFALRDGLLITGQQQYSGAAAARLVVEALGR